MPLLLESVHEWYANKRTQFCKNGTLSSLHTWVLLMVPSAVACCIRAGYGLHTGHAILMRSNASKWPGGSTLFSLALLRSLSSGQWSPGEQQELLARRVQLLRYLLRSPCYNAFTRWV